MIPYKICAVTEGGRMEELYEKKLCMRYDKGK